MRVFLIGAALLTLVAIFGHALTMFGVALAQQQQAPPLEDQLAMCRAESAEIRAVRDFYEQKVAALQVALGKAQAQAKATKDAADGEKPKAPAKTPTDKK